MRLKAQHQLVARLRLQQGIFNRRGIQPDHGSRVKTEGLVLHRHIQHTHQRPLRITDRRGGAAQRMQPFEVML